MKTWCILVLACLCAPATGQRLHLAVARANVVAIAKEIGIQPLGDQLFLHRMVTVESLKGNAPATFTVVERKRVTDQPRPTPAQARIYCLEIDRQPDLPGRFAPYYRMTGHAGSNPLPTEPHDADPSVRLVRTLVRSEKGQGPARTAGELLQLAIHSDGPARTEAVQVLRERSVLADSLSHPQLSDLLSRAVGETDDIPYKIALASLCVERRLNGVIDALCMSVESTGDEQFARVLGRLARYVHGEEAIGVLRPRIGKARTDKERDLLLLALGATGTDTALRALLRLRRVDGPSPHVDAALRAHGSRRALEAVESTGKKK